MQFSKQIGEIATLQLVADGAGHEATVAPSTNAALHFGDQFLVDGHGEFSGAIDFLLHCY